MKKRLDLIDEMNTSICKIKCMSYLLETQSLDCLQPTEYEEIQYGLTLILNEIVQEFVQIKGKMEKDCLK